MAKYVLIGHGSIKVDDGTYLPQVLVPPSTKLRFYSDGGQALLLPQDEFFKSKGVDLMDWFEVVDAWETFKPEDSAMEFQRVTYNFLMNPEPKGSRNIAREIDWGLDGGVLTPDDSEVFRLCTGKTPAGPGIADGCPTGALLTAPIDMGEGNEPWVPGEEDWKHHCDGILKKYAGHELHWLACSGFEGLSKELERRLAVLATGAAAGPGAVVWDPATVGNPDVRVEGLPIGEFLAKQNEKNVTEGTLNEPVALVTAENVLLIGPGHKAQFVDYVRGVPHEEGTLTVHPAAEGAKLPRVVVTGITQRREFVAKEIARFYHGQVEFQA